jgi:hypothetical protein
MSSARISNLAGVHADLYLDVQGTHRIADRASAAHRPGGPIERRKEPVAQRLDLPSAKALELTPHDRVVLLHNAAPAFVAGFARTRG